jgi:enoyl-CoA hydratase
MELALTGEAFTAERAHALGMVNVLAEPGGALDAAIELAERITVNGPLAVAATKRIIVESRGWSPDTMFGEQNKILMPVFSSNDAREGAIAFAEKRPAHWSPPRTAPTRRRWWGPVPDPAPGCASSPHARPARGR